MAGGKTPGLSSGTTGEPGTTTGPPEELEDLAARARELTEQAAETYVIFNNHPAGQAVANALELAHPLNPGRGVTVPPTLLAAFPKIGRNGYGGEDREDKTGYQE